MTPPLRPIQVPCALKRSLTLPSSNWVGSPTLNLLGGSESTLGKRKRMQPSRKPTLVAVKATQATPNQVTKVRRVLPAAAGLGGAGFGGAAVAAAVAAAAGGPETFAGSDMQSRSRSVA